MYGAIIPYAAELQSRGPSGVDSSERAQPVWMIGLIVWSCNPGKAGPALSLDRSGRAWRALRISKLRKTQWHRQQRLNPLSRLECGGDALAVAKASSLAGFSSSPHAATSAGLIT